MFYFRLNRVFVHSNFRRTLFRRRDHTDVAIYCFVTTGNNPLPALEELTKVQDAHEKQLLIKKAVKQALESRIFTPVQNVKDEHELTFGDTGFVLYEDNKIPDNFNFQMVIIGNRNKQRQQADMWSAVEQDEQLNDLVNTAVDLLSSFNPIVTIGTEIGKYLTGLILRTYAHQEDDQLGIIYQSWNRIEHYPHGERKRDRVKDLTGNVEYDYSLFGFEPSEAAANSNWQW